MLNLLIMTCSHRNITTATTSCIELFRIKTNVSYLWLKQDGDALLSRSRSIACYQFLTRDLAPYMLFLDFDIVFKPEHIDKIYKDMCNGYDLIGGVYAVRDGTQPASYSWGGNIVDDKGQHIFKDGKIHEVEYVATGFLGISKRLLKKMVDELPLPLLNPNDWSTCYPFFECGRNLEREGDPIYISEDWDFCEKARKVGVKSYVDSEVQLGHLGEVTFTMDHVYEHRSKQEVTDGTKNRL